MGTLLGSPQRHTTTMNTFLYFSALVASSLAAPQQVTLKGHGVPTLVRAPAHDSASIEHHRLGGNFAYSTAEAHAFASVTPQISTLTHPVAETTHTHIPSPWSTRPAPTLSRRAPRPSPPPWHRTLEFPSLLSRLTLPAGLPMSPPPFPLPDTPWSDTLPSDTPDTLASPLLPDTPDTPDTLWPLPHTKLVQPIPCTLQSELYHECSDRLRHTLQEGGGQWWLFFVVASVLRRTKQCLKPAPVRRHNS